MRYLIFVLMVTGAIGFIAYQLLSFGRFMRFKSRDNANDVLDLMDLLREVRKTLVPLTSTELENLSLRAGYRKVAGDREQTLIGVYESVYHEPLIAFAYRDYDMGRQSLLIAQSVDETWRYEIKGRQTLVYINDQAVGRINSDGTLQGLTTNRVLAAIDINNQRTHTVAVGDQEVGHVVVEVDKGAVNPRAVQLYKTLEKDEQDLFLSLAILSMVQEEVEAA